MTAKKKPTISGIMKQERITEKARKLYYKHDENLDNMKDRIEEGTTETIDGVTYVAVRKRDRYSSNVITFIELKK